MWLVHSQIRNLNLLYYIFQLFNLFFTFIENILSDIYFILKNIEIKILQKIFLEKKLKW